MAPRSRRSSLSRGLTVVSLIALAGCGVSGPASGTAGSARPSAAEPAADGPSAVTAARASQPSATRARTSPPAATPARTGPSASTSPSARTSPSAVSSGGQPTPTGPASGAVPRPAHTVVVMMENHSYADIIGNSDAPFLNGLAGRGALFTSSYAVTHPSEPNYLALFSGSTQGLSDDSCPHTFTGPNLAAGLLAAGMSFAGYAEDLPAVGSSVCTQGNYARKHVPWTDFSNIPGSVNQPFTNWPAGDFARLPTVSFVIPNLCDDMHDCGVATGDAWLRAHIGGYADWAMTHDSLLIITWDEDDNSQNNQITTIFAGQPVHPGRYAEQITHYNVLATIEAAYGLPRDGQAATVRPITDVWA